LRLHLIRGGAHRASHGQHQVFSASVSALPLLSVLDLLGQFGSLWQFDWGVRVESVIKNSKHGALIIEEGPIINFARGELLSKPSMREARAVHRLNARHSSNKLINRLRVGYTIVRCIWRVDL